MKVILNIKDSKAAFIMEMLAGFSGYVKAKPISEAKAKVIESLVHSSEGVRLHKKGKLTLKSADDLLNEL
jgi:hypothetical protein